MNNLTNLKHGKAEDIILLEIIKNTANVSEQLNPKSPVPLGDIVRYMLASDGLAIGKMSILPNLTEVQVLDYLGKRFEKEGLYFYNS